MIVEIEEKKIGKLSEHIEESLKHMGKAMQCVDEWMNESGSIGQRSGYGNRNYGGGSSYGNRYGGGYGMRDNDDWEDEDEMIGERRGRRRRDSRGRYM